MQPVTLSRYNKMPDCYIGFNLFHYLVIASKWKNLFEKPS